MVAADFTITPGQISDALIGRVPVTTGMGIGKCKLTQQKG
jgi:hypothetical protein